MTTDTRVNVLLIGGGGREHAIAWKLAQSPRLGKLWLTDNSNPGLAAFGTAANLGAIVLECVVEKMSEATARISVPAMIGVVELLARDAWLRMTQGPLKGKEFLLFKEVMNVGSSPRSDLYLFNDPLVAEHHAVIRAVGDEYEIESRQSSTPVLVNGRSVNRARLRHGDNVGVGRTEFIFQKKK